MTKIFRSFLIFFLFLKLQVGVSGHVTLSCNQWRNTAFHLYVVFMQFLKVYSYVKKLFFVIHN